MFYAMESIVNFRDLGGIVTRDSKVVKPNLLFRSANLSTATDNDVARLQKFGIKAIFDFRDADEAVTERDAEVLGAKYMNLPALDPDLFHVGTDHEAKMAWLKKNVALSFRYLYDNLAGGAEAVQAYRVFFRFLADNPGSAVLWHCAQGKDRTGIAALLILTVLGVDMDSIMDEYLLTNVVATAVISEAIRSGASQEKIEFMRITQLAHKSYVDIFMDGVRQRFGSLESFIRDALGVDENMTAVLRKAYLQ